MNSRYNLQNVSLVQSGLSNSDATQLTTMPAALTRPVKKGIPPTIAGFHIVQQGLLNRTQIGFQSAFQTNSSFDPSGMASANIFLPNISERHLMQACRQISEIPTLPVDLYLEKKMDDFFATVKKQPVKLHSRRS